MRLNGYLRDPPRILKAIISLGHALGLTTTAEGIENHAVLEGLTKLGCDTGQGYLFGLPEPASVTTETLRETGKSANRPRQIA